jgi:hypothetical protein
LGYARFQGYGHTKIRE